MAYIVKKAYGQMWILCRLKALGASRTRLLDVLQKQMLRPLNLGVPAWDCLLTEQEKVDFKGVPKQDYKLFESTNVQLLKKLSTREIFVQEICMKINQAQEI